jgi:hypothetical protein
MYELFSFFDTPHAKSVLAAIGGGIISKRFKATMSRGVWASSIAAGAVMAYFIALPIAEWIGDEKASGVVGLFVGLFGLAICDALENAIRTTQWGDIIKKRLGGE